MLLIMSCFLPLAVVVVVCPPPLLRSAPLLLEQAFFHLFLLTLYFFRNTLSPFLTLFPLVPFRSLQCPCERYRLSPLCAALCWSDRQRYFCCLHIIIYLPRTPLFTALNGSRVWFPTYRFTTTLALLPPTRSSSLPRSTMCKGKTPARAKRRRCHHHHQRG